MGKEKDSAIAKMIIARREKLQLSKREVARSIGCSVQMLANWEAVRAFPTDSFVDGLAEFLGMTTKNLEVAIEKSAGRPIRSTAVVLLKDATITNDSLMDVEALDRLKAIVQANGRPMPLGLLLTIFKSQSV